MFESGRRNIFVNQKQPIFLKIKATLSLKKEWWWVWPPFDYVVTPSWFGVVL